ncbi:photoreceptor ankyrin repeat protein [Sebastes fasciatus]|uniref:photoreceptor ankyrin repeat protein n=1 Tax=Sebastes fasciatus TaxID=394691 RepID=UPI003D9E4698
MAVAAKDPHLGSGPDEDDVSLSESDSDSILSDDSVLPDYTSETTDSRAASTLYQACARNEHVSLRKVLERGVTKEEVRELDINGWNGLMVACCKGFVDIVYGLQTCPFIDINHQDNEGNTAVMIASQAGHVNTVMYLLNYYPGIDTEIRDCRGFTALIKAAMTGRTDVMAALVMAGADIHAVDTTRGKCAQDWALKTGRYETLHRLRRLNMRPKAEQCCESYVPDWPELQERVAKATSEKTAKEKITQRIKSSFGFRFPRDPQDDGALDHMVRMTTSVHSPLISTGCRPLCPTSPPEVGKRRLAVPELMKKHPDKELESPVCHSNGSVSHMIPSIHSAEAIHTTCCAETQRRDSLLSLASAKVATAFIPRSMARRNSIFPSGCIPKIDISRPSDATPKKEKKKKKKRENGFLELPKPRYKEIKEEKKREKKKADKEKAEKEKEKKEKKKGKDDKKAKN